LIGAARNDHMTVPVDMVGDLPTLLTMVGGKAATAKARWPRALAKP
jgi:hypothetical protein